MKKCKTLVLEAINICLRSNIRQKECLNVKASLKTCNKADSISKNNLIISFKNSLQPTCNYVKAQIL